MALYGIEGENRRKGKQYILWENGDIWDYIENNIREIYHLKKMGEILSIGTFRNV